MISRCRISDGLGIVGNSQAIVSLRSFISKVGPRPCTVLISGECGTGKELVAQGLHKAGNSEAPFVTVDCATLTDSLVESQLFGHARGSFTGATEETPGYLRLADGGTVFFDEVGELSLSAQARLLRFLQEYTVVPVGSTMPINVNARVLAATNRNLEEMVERGCFREDLYFRLNVVALRLAPLRDFPEDIPELVRHFHMRLAARYEESFAWFTDAAMSKLCAYHWPGNVRELAHAVEHALVVAAGAAPGPEHLPARIHSVLSNSTNIRQGRASGVMSLDAAKKQLLENALRQTHGNEGQAAKLLQIERRRFYRLVRRYHLEGLTRSRCHAVAH